MGTALHSLLPARFRGNGRFRWIRPIFRGGRILPFSAPSGPGAVRFCPAARFCASLKHRAQSAAAASRSFDLRRIPAGLPLA